MFTSVYVCTVLKKMCTQNWYTLSTDYFEPCGFIVQLQHLLSFIFYFERLWALNKLETYRNTGLYIMLK